MLKIFQDERQDGAVLMARDAKLLEAAAAGEGQDIVRFYEWSEPTISLGFHQKESLLDATALESNNTPWVRRPTGGAAVLHSDELTYAVAMGNLTAPGAAGLVHEYIGRAITAGLVALGVSAQLEARGEPLSALPNRTSCFTRTSRWEVTVKGRKLVGSAQRKLGNAVLQHGSILLGNDHLRIVDYLDFSSPNDREVLRGKLAARSTSVEQELKQRLPMEDVRSAMEAAFREVLTPLPELLASQGVAAPQ